jgi:hypothetical protein
MSDWPFDQAPNFAAITTINVLDRGAPILVVVHYADGDGWAFSVAQPTMRAMPG